MRWIRRIELINVMSHEHTVLELSDGINVLVGRRGSGKTTVIEALRIAFGGLGRERQKQLSRFIRHGADEAVIRIHLSNAVRLPGRGLVRLIPELPDWAEVVLECVIRREGSPPREWRLNGKKIRLHELEKILARVNISPRNLLYFLPQERVNEWVSLKPAERLELFMSAMGLLELKQKIVSLRKKVEEKRQEKRRLERELNRLESEWLEEERSFRFFSAHKERLWRYFILRLAKLYAEKSEYLSRISQLRDEEKKLRKDLESLKSRLSALEAERREIDQEIKRLERRREEARNERVAIEYKMKRLEEEIDKLRNRLVDYENLVKQAEQEVERIRKKWGISSPEELERLIEKKKREKEEIENELLQTEEYRMIREREREIERLRIREKEIKSTREELLKGLQESLSLLDPSGRLYKLVLELEELRETEITLADIYGPLAFLLDTDLSDEEFESIALALDAALPMRLKSAFVALSQTAMRRLKDLCHKHGVTRIPIIVPSVRGVPSHSSVESLRILQRIIEEARRRRELLKRSLRERLGDKYARAVVYWVPEVLTGPEPVIALIEAECWNVPIVQDEDYAFEILRASPEITRVVTLDGTLVRKRVERLSGAMFLEIIPHHARDPRRLCIARAREFNLERLRQQMEALDESLADIRRSIRRLESEIAQLRSKLPESARRLEERLKSLTREIVELHKLKYPLQHWLSRLRRLPEEQRKIREAIEYLDEQMDRLVRRKIQLDEEEREIQVLRERLEKRKEEILSEWGEVKTKIEELERRLEELPAQRRFLEREVTRLDSEVERVREEILALIELLKRCGDYPADVSAEEILEKEIESVARDLAGRLPLAEIEAELRGLAAKAEKYKKALQALEGRLQELARLRQEVEKKRKEVERAEQELREVEELVRRELEKLIQALREKVELVDRHYRRVLSAIGAHGSVSISGSHLDNLSLRVTVDLHRDRPVELEEGGFSSGEKTTAIMALIIAMFLTSPAPIFLFDEFDVYLDDLSLSEVCALIKSTLGSFQGIITTTHRPQIIDIADRVFYLEYDERRRATRVVMIPKE